MHDLTMPQGHDMRWATQARMEAATGGGAPTPWRTETEQMVLGGSMQVAHE
jgi:hypothetical protein